ncbi:MAG: hypothetical protein D8M58_03060 [Calditrichaeota bacterium]|nr:MAG: hypothetical protein DWQ03_04020 [Calditrichota bacterium]MBL1204345.1 hypothetical protein [Calditrichota bacterium]NOG44174.1 hypothetical protein [Calditrichota bacterium]
MKSLNVLLVVLLIFVYGCLDSKPKPPGTQPTHPLVKNLSPPDVNKPVKTSPIPVKRIKPQLPNDDQPALIMLRDEQPFSGKISMKGSVDIGTDFIDFKSIEGEKSETVRILYRLPQDMMKLSVDAFDGSIEIMELSGSQGANRQTLVKEKQSLRFAEFWQISEKPLEVALGAFTSIVQQKINQKTKGTEYTEAEVNIIDKGKSVSTIPIGESTLVKTSVGSLSVYLELSHFYNSDDEGLKQYPSGYMLHLWVVGQR